MYTRRFVAAIILSLVLVVALLTALATPVHPSRAGAVPVAMVQAPASGETGILREAAAQIGLGVGERSAKERVGSDRQGAGSELGGDRKWSALRSQPDTPTIGARHTAGGIANGNFESGPDGSWEEYSLQGWPLILNEEVLLAPPHGGSWAVWLGGDDDEISVIRQVVAIPTQDPTLRFWIWIASQDACGYDFGGVIANDDTVVDVFDLCVDTNTNGWVQHSVNLVDYAGQTAVPLQIRVETDESVNSNLFVDDVTLGSVQTGDVRVYVPLALKNWSSQPPVGYAPPCSASNGYCEPYNTWKTAYGPLEPGVPYLAYPNDNNDYYWFSIDQTTSLTVHVTDYAATGQVLVRRQDLTEVAKDYNVPPGADGNMTVPLPSLPAGSYYIQVFTSGGFNESTRYTLRITQ